MADSPNLFKRLGRLFSTSVIVRNVGGKKLKVIDTDNLQAYLSNGYKDRYSRIYSSSGMGNALSNQYGINMAYQTQRIMLFREYDIMDCIGENTRIPLLDGSSPTIKELSERYTDPSERFYVYSYDTNTGKIVAGKAYFPHLKGVRDVKKITFDDGKELITTDDHLILLRSGEYVKTKDLKVGDSVMPFYRKDFYKNGYRMLYNFKQGWQAEHKVIAESEYRILSEDEVVHHIDFNKSNNFPHNLKIMSKSDHSAYHLKINNENIWSDENREKQINSIRNSMSYRKHHKWNGKRAGKNNPFYGKSHSKKSNIIRSSSIKHLYDIGKLNASGENNARYRDDITADCIKNVCIDLYKSNGKFNLTELTKYFNCDSSVIRNRVNNWPNFKKDIMLSLNHKVVSIESAGSMPVYDLTVETYHNFATDTCFVHNCDPIINSAFDLYADECTTRDEFGDILRIECEDENIKEILHNLFYDILNLDFNLWPWVRNMCKYGDQFLFLEINEKYGVVSVTPLSVYDTIRVEGEDPQNPQKVYFQTMGMNGQKMKFENYEISHFRLLSDSNFLPYGKGVGEGARRTWKQLTLLEDAMLIHRIMRAPEKRVIKLDVGNIPPAEIDTHIQRAMDRMKKVPFMDPTTGDYNLRYNMQNVLEDFYIPVRGGDSGSDISNLGGLEFNSIEDIEYLRNKMMAALKIPKAFLGYEEGISGKLVLAAEDVRFARTIQRIQSIIIGELTKIAVIHLYSQGYTDADLVSFNLKMNVASTIAEQEKLNLWKEKVQLANDLKSSKLISNEWIYKNVFNMSERDMEYERARVVEDVKSDYRVSQIEQGQADPAKYGYPQEKAPPEEEATSEESPTTEEYSEIDLGGRPKEGMHYGQDSHPLGRDPLGFKERYKAIRHSKENRRKQPLKSPLSLEMLDNMKTKKLRMTSLLNENIETRDKFDVN